MTQFKANEIIESEIVDAVGILPISETEPVGALRVNLTSLNLIDDIAWLCTAILSHLDLGVGLTDHSLVLIEQIRTMEDVRAEFEKAYLNVTSLNMFGIVEIEPEEGLIIRKYLCL